MTELPPARSAQQRKRDTLQRLETDIDAWVATAGARGGAPCLAPFSFLWDGEAVLIAAPATGATGRNLLANGQARLGLGTTRDVVLITGTAEPMLPRDLPDAVGDAFAGKTGFDPRHNPDTYRYFRITPQRIRAWREENELTGRDVLRDGAWLVAD
ncbi:MAG: pyridoxamine 5'-phosphate oxidase family protein [Thermomicrobiales bacterium]|nr:pyridoxamine 5'-phosphate oxidase family protein [Thermomicrobiales bacterium]